MPYQLPDTIGGDNKENTTWMEECVKKLSEKGYSKPDSIAICKATLIRLKGNTTAASFFIDLYFQNKP